MLLQTERESVVEYGRKLAAHHLTRGTGGNVSVCELYCRARSMGKPVLLSESDMAVVLKKFKSYGQRD